MSPRRFAAKALMFISNSHDEAERRLRPIVERIRRKMRRYILTPGFLMRLAFRIDERAPCPYCGRQKAKVELEMLGTYCFECSHWGHDPREVEDVL